MQKAIESAVFMMFHQTCGRALQAVYDGLDLADKTGVHMCDPMLIAYGSYTCLSMQCPEKGIDFLRKLEGTVEHLGRFHRSLFNYLIGWHHLLGGDAARAALYATQSLNLAVAAGIPFPEMIVRLLLAETFTEKGESTRAKEELKTIAQIARKTRSWLMEYLSLLCEAHIVLDSGDDRGATRLLERAFALGGVQNFRSLLFWWRPAKMTRLCVKALEAGIEEDFVQSLVRELKLLPEGAPVELENWPWPLRIYTLG